MANFKRSGIEEYTDSLAAYLPNDKLFAAKTVNGSNLRALLKGAAWELYRANSYLREYTNDIIPDETYHLIDEWESAVGIPDDCFPGTGSAEERRQDILIKLASLGVQTVDDFAWLGSLLGISVTVIPAAQSSVFPLVLPFLLFGTEQEARFTIVVEYSVASVSTFPFTFPIIFGSKRLGKLQCVLQRLKPANCNIVFIQL